MYNHVFLPFRAVFRVGVGWGFNSPPPQFFSGRGGGLIAVYIAGKCQMYSLYKIGFQFILPNMMYCTGKVCTIFE